MSQWAAGEKPGKFPFRRTNIQRFFCEKAVRTMKRLFLIAVLSTDLGIAVAQTAPPPVPYPEAPAIPSATYRGEAVEPEVTIIETEKGIVYEYRVRGRLYMVRVQPQVGPPYFLLDTDGDGQMDVQQDRVWNNSIPQWVLFSW